MKKVYFLFTVVVSVLFASCFEAEEKTVINSDESGTYSITMDISGMMQQLESMTGKSADNEDGPQKKDSVFYFKDYTDTSTTLTAEEKVLLQDGSLGIHVDSETDEMKFVITVPFKNTKQLPVLKEALANAMEKIKMNDKLMDGEAPGQLDAMAQKGPGASMAVNPLQGAFSLSIGDKMITNKLTDPSFVNDMLAANPSLQSIKQMAPMFGDLKYKTTYVLPGAVKNYKGSNATVSDDKKTISFTSNLTDMFDTPNILEYEVEY